MAEREPLRGSAPGLAVVGYGMWTALGPDGPSTVAGLRSRLIVSEAGNLWDPTAGANLPAFRVHAHQWWSGPTFLPELIVPVIEECRAEIGRLKPESLRRDPARVPVLICLPPPHRPGRAEGIEALVMEGVARRLGQPLPPGSGVIGAGRVGLPHLLAEAGRQAGAHPLQIIVGAESFLSQPLVEHYIGRMRLLCGANSSGFVPGEAAAGLVVAPPGLVEGPELVIAGMGAGTEASRDGGSREAPVTARGLTNAMKAALAIAGRAYMDIPNLFGDLNGEHFKFKEAAMATMRVDAAPPEGRSRRPRGHVEHWNVIEGTGEIGAALMPAQAGWAFAAGCAGRLQQGRAMIFAGEDDGQRVAMVVEMRGNRS
ncbi:MAG: 3-oxoacyl-ACP synthase [Rhodobacteraceae bacterium]|nr:3-oxoacyl-ACP synthase [Paracoccaceae bacterium]